MAQADAGVLGDLAVLRDPEHLYSIANVSEADPAVFRPLQGGLSAGYTRAVHWLKFTVQRSPGETGELWLEIQPPYLDDIRLYEPDPVQPGQFRERRAGDHLPFAAREVAYRAFIFRLDPPDEQAHTYFLRLQTSSTSALLLQLWRPDVFQAAVAKEMGLLGGYFGVIMVTVLAHLVYWLWLRNALYICYVIYLMVTACALFGTNGLAAQYLFQDGPLLNNLWVAIASLCSSATAGLFFSRILFISRNNVWLFRLYRLQIAVPAVSLLLIPGGHYTEAAALVNWLNLLAGLASVGHAFRLYLGGMPGGIFLLVSLSLFLAGLFPMLLKTLGLLPYSALWVFHGIQIAAVGHVLMMNLAVSARMRSIEQARQEAVVLAGESEAVAQQERRFRGHQSRFLAMLSHELKTPLSVIEGAVQSLERLPGAEHAEVVRRHRRIRQSVERLDVLLGQCLTQDRLDDSGLVPRFSAVDIVGLLNTLVADRLENNAPILLQAPAALYLSGDFALLHIALVNLIDNALKYSPPDTLVRVSVGEAAVEKQNGVEVLVADSGPGIPAALAERIFEPFVRGEQQGDISGAGLGLYLVRRIVELHQGYIRLLEQSQGACFYIWLPTVRGETLP
jgi:signal transduction histidine kinase